jgi:hypothetical protein
MVPILTVLIFAHTTIDIIKETIISTAATAYKIIIVVPAESAERSKTLFKIKYKIQEKAKIAKKQTPATIRLLLNKLDLFWVRICPSTPTGLTTCSGEFEFEIG